MPQEWFDLNYRLQEEAADSNINRVFLESWIIRLSAMIDSDSRCFGLFMARINELALYCASRYADCGEIHAAGEMLLDKNSFCFKTGEKSFQDRGIYKQKCNPCLFADQLDFPQAPVKSLLQRDTLIPCLCRLMEDLGYLSENYISSIYHRIMKIMKVIGIFNEQGIDSCEKFSQKLSLANDPERRLYRSIGCSFNKGIFNDLGRDLHLFMRYGKSNYLK